MLLSRWCTLVLLWCVLFFFLIQTVLQMPVSAIGPQRHISLHSCWHLVLSGPILTKRIAIKVTRKTAGFWRISKEIHLPLLWAIFCSDTGTQANKYDLSEPVRKFLCSSAFDIIHPSSLMEWKNCFSSCFYYIFAELQGDADRRVVSQSCCQQLFSSWQSKCQGSTRKEWLHVVFWSMSDKVWKMQFCNWPLKAGLTSQ